jgi:hypothetical protein
MIGTVAFVRDLMDRSHISAAIPGAAFVSDPASAADAAVVIVDLARFGGSVTTIRAAAPQARIVAFGPHVDDDLLGAATADGADRVLPRSQFFRDPAAAIT